MASRTYDLDDATLSLYRRIVGGEASPGAVAALALRLAESGFVRTKGQVDVDLASTGGPSSLSTLLGPLLLVARGCAVPKLAVPGRPAGGIDVLNTVPGYNIELDPSSFERVMTACGYAHAMAGGFWAPADAALFRRRQQAGHQAIPALAVASLVAKKVAMGVCVAGLEARVAAHGNFGATLARAHESAELYREVCFELGLTPVVILTDASVPFQPYIGRGEAVVATHEALTAPGDPWLTRHFNLCAAMADLVSTSADNALLRPADSDAWSTHVQNLLAQGSSPSAWAERVAATNSATRVDVTTDKAGYVHYDLGAIRSYLGQLQQSGTADATRTDASPDDLAGAVLLVAPRTEVRVGDPVLSVRGMTEAVTPPTTLFAVLPEPPAADNTVLEVLRP